MEAIALRQRTEGAMETLQLATTRMAAVLDQAPKATDLLKLQAMMEPLQVETAHPLVVEAPEMLVDSPQARMARVFLLMEPLLVTEALQAVVQGAQVSKEVLAMATAKVAAAAAATLQVLHPVAM